MPTSKKGGIFPLQISSPMEETGISKQPIKGTHKSQKKAHQKAEKPPPWTSFRNLFSCKYHQTAVGEEDKKKKLKRTGWSASLCNLKESSKVMQRPEPTSPEVFKSGRSASNSSRSLKSPLIEIHGPLPNSSSSCSSSHFSASITPSSTTSSSSLGGSFRGMQLRRLSGCYECHMVVDPINGVTRIPSLRRTVIATCSECGEIFTKSESLEVHQAIKHAVSELGPDDTSRNIVEIIFQSSWLKKQSPVCKIDRILKVHNTQKTITRFEGYRDSIKSKANKLAKKHPRCIADGNELLRFYCTTFNCSLGLKGLTNLCVSTPNCNVCSIIRDGFKLDGHGRIATMATSGRAHDAAKIAAGGGERAMLVCRVIAGRVNKSQEASEECDSVAGSVGIYSNLDELFVFDPKAILPCFVVIYRGF